MRSGPVHDRGAFHSANVDFYQSDGIDGEEDAKAEIRAQGGSRFSADCSNKTQKTKRSNSESDLDRFGKKERHKNASHKLRSFFDKNRMFKNKPDASLSAPDLSGSHHTFGEEVFKEFEDARSKLLAMRRRDGIKLDSNSMIEAYMKEGFERGLIAGYERLSSADEAKLSTAYGAGFGEIDFSVKKSGKDAFNFGYMEGFKRGIRKEQLNY